MMKEAEYLELLERIERENPREPLLATLRGGYSRVNAIFMKSAAGRLPEESDQVDDVEEPDDVETRSDDATLNGLYDEKRRLFGQMNRQSNVFHTCRSDEQRAENSRAVLAFWDAILQVKARIKYYLEHGELPKEATENDELPDNAVLLGKKLNSIRAQISQIKNRLECLLERPEEDRDKARLIREDEEKLRKKIHLRGLAEQKLKSLENG